MQKRTLRTPSHPTVSRPSQDSGLMVTAKKSKPSARTESALDHRSHRTEVRFWRHPFVSVCVVSPNLLVAAREALVTSARGHRWKLESVYSSGARQAISPACLAWLSQVYCETWPEIFTSQPEFFRESPQQREAYL
jgi:hypothetical protein